MKLTVLNSNSKGNCYLLHNNNECLVLECGVSLKEVKKALDFNVGIINGAVVSHLHTDHAKYISEYVKSGIKVYGHESVFANIETRYVNLCEPLTHLQTKLIGRYTVKCFSVYHDVPCLAFIIKHEEMGNLFFAIDTTQIDYKIKHLQHIMVECNYAEDILERNVLEGIIPMAQFKRLQQSHFELCNVEAFLGATPSEELRDVVLLHLSDSNSDEARFKRACERVIGVPTYIAKSGLKIDLLK